MIAPLLPVYNRADFTVERGEGVWLFTGDGRKMLDFASGIAVNSLGHCHPHLVKALQSQAEVLWHVSNMYQIPGQQRLAERLVAHSCADSVYFCNSGAEAVETAIKMARKYHDKTGHPDKYRIITFSGAFHGRTMACISAARKPATCDGFAPLLDGFDQVPFNDIEAVKAAMTPETGAIMLEPIQGEGGIRNASLEFLRALRALCDEQGLLLICDEVQCGTGRSGKLFAFEYAEIEADIIASAKGIGGGFPLGACLAREHVAETMEAGSHGGTYGGNPLAMAVGNAVMDVILEDGFLKSVHDKGEKLGEALKHIQESYPKIFTEVRGRGLIRGLTLVDTIDVRDVVQELRALGLLTVGAGENTIRIVPPLTVEEDHIQQAADIIRQCAAQR